MTYWHSLSGPWLRSSVYPWTFWQQGTRLCDRTRASAQEGQQTSSFIERKGTISLLIPFSSVIHSCLKISFLAVLVFFLRRVVHWCMHLLLSWLAVLRVLFLILCPVSSWSRSKTRKKKDKGKYFLVLDFKSLPGWHEGRQQR